MSIPPAPDWPDWPAEEAPDWSDFEPMREEDEEIIRFSLLEWLFLLKCPDLLKL